MGSMEPISPPSFEMLRQVFNYLLSFLRLIRVTSLLSFLRVVRVIRVISLLSFLWVIRLIRVISLLSFLRVVRVLELLGLIVLFCRCVIIGWIVSETDKIVQFVDVW